MPKFKVGDRISPIISWLPVLEVTQVFSDGYTFAKHYFDSAPDISRWDMAEADDRFEVPITREDHDKEVAEIHALYAPVVEALKRLDSFCREQFDKVPMPVQQKKQWHDVLAMSQAALAAALARVRQLEAGLMKIRNRAGSINHTDDVIYDMTTDALKVTK